MSKYKFVRHIRAFHKRPERFCINPGGQFYVSACVVITLAQFSVNQTARAALDVKTSRPYDR